MKVKGPGCAGKGVKTETRERHNDRALARGVLRNVQLPEVTKVNNKEIKTGNFRSIQNIVSPFIM